MFAQSINCEYTLELPRRSSSNEYYPQSMSWNKNWKNMFIPVNPNVGYEGYSFHGHISLMQTNK